MTLVDVRDEAWRLWRMQRELRLAEQARDECAAGGELSYAETWGQLADELRGKVALQRALVLDVGVACIERFFGER